MEVSPWLLSVDSFIVAVALSATLSLRHVVPLIALFGVCDAIASLLAPSVETLVAPSWLASASLIAGGTASLLNLRWSARSPRHLGIASALMAALGAATSLLLLRAAGRRASRPWLPSALLISAGVILAG